MSIKGKSQELYIGKTEVNIKDYQWGYKLIKIHYSDISKIEYCFLLKSEIDAWLHDGKRKSQKELAEEAAQFINAKRNRPF